MSELASESMSTIRAADASDVGGRTRKSNNVLTSGPRVGLPEEIA